MFPPKKIVCPLDFSEASMQALTQAAELASLCGAELSLIHVLPPLPADFVLSVPEFQRELDAAAEQRLRSAAEPLQAKGLRLALIVVHGEAAEEILRIGQESGADLIVIATHGTTIRHHDGGGSVTKEVVRSAPCSVLTVRSAQWHEQPLYMSGSYWAPLTPSPSPAG